jgi:hypothetical protein
VVLRERQEQGRDARILRVSLGNDADTKMKHEHKEDNIESHGSWDVKRREDEMRERRGDPILTGLRRDLFIRRSMMGPGRLLIGHHPPRRTLNLLIKFGTKDDSKRSALLVDAMHRIRIEDGGKGRRC